MKKGSTRCTGNRKPLIERIAENRLKAGVEKHFITDAGGIIQVTYSYICATNWYVYTGSIMLNGTINHHYRLENDDVQSL